MCSGVKIYKIYQINYLKLNEKILGIVVLGLLLSGDAHAKIDWEKKIK